MKLREFQNVLAGKKIDVALLYNFNFQEKSSSMIYFTGYSGVGFLVIPKSKKPFLAVPEMEYIRAKRQSKFRVVRFEKNLAELIESIGNVNRVGIEENKMSLAFYKRLKKELKAGYVDISGDIALLRMIKKKQEIHYLEKACSITDDIFQKMMGNFKNFRTEKEACAFLQSEAEKKGCEMAFDPMVASGIHSTQAHFEPDGRLRKGFCIIDFGVSYKGYHSDMTRTVYIGIPSRQELEDYGLVLKAQLDAITSLKPGVKASEVDAVARKSLGSKAKAFNHSLGHGVGIDIHESPNIGPKGEEKLQNDMVFTIEPAIYLKGRYGIRIEDTILLQEKALVLTKTPKHLLIVNNRK